MQTEELNSYNLIRNVPIKMKYKPIQVKLRDDSASVVATLLKAYRDHYHYSGAAESFDDFGDALLDRGGSLDSMGLRTREQRHFFREIVLYDLGTSPSSVNVYRLVNPMITSIDHGELDYGQTNDFVEVNLTIQYEGYHEVTGRPATEFPEAFVQIGGSPASVEPQSGVVSSGIQQQASIGDRIQSALGDLLNDGAEDVLASLKQSESSSFGDPIAKLKDSVLESDRTRDAGSSLIQRAWNGLNVVPLLENAVKSELTSSSVGSPFSDGKFVERASQRAAKSAVDTMLGALVGGTSWMDLLE
jgi:hypothetical protein